LREQSAAKPQHGVLDKRRRNTESAASFARRKSSLFGLEAERGGQSSPSSMGTIHRNASLPLNHPENRLRSRTISHTSSSAPSGIMASPLGMMMAQSNRSRANSLAVGAAGVRRAPDMQGMTDRDGKVSQGSVRRRTMSSSAGFSGSRTLR
jgi:hypothetical protein